MKKLIFSLGILMVMLFSSCEKDESVTSPQENNNNGVSSMFKQNLQKEIESENENVTIPEGFVHEITGSTTITEPGIYKVVNDFTASEDGIVINSNWVLLWIGNHTITGPGNKVGRGVVIDESQFVLVFGGKLETFGTGVSLENSSKSAVKNVRVQGADEFADPPNVPPQVGILLLNSNWNLIAGNTAHFINLGIFVRGPGSHNNRIFSNRIRGGVNGLLGICYNPAPDGEPGGPMFDNVFLNDIRRFGIGIQTAAAAAQNKFTFNRIFYFNLPWEDLNGSNIFLRNNVVQITL